VLTRPEAATLAAFIVTVWRRQGATHMVTSGGVARGATPGPDYQHQLPLLDTVLDELAAHIWEYPEYTWSPDVANEKWLAGFSWEKELREARKHATIHDGAPPEWAQAEWPHWIQELGVRDTAAGIRPAWIRVDYSGPEPTYTPEIAARVVRLTTDPRPMPSTFDTLRCYPCQPDSPLPVAWPDDPAYRAMLKQALDPEVGRA
jgi:hypothetical protein